MYWLLKDFAGPIATVIAAGVAAYFVRQQWRTAEKQADTALDQLRYNLFEKRYAIYNDVKQLLRLLLNETRNKNFRPVDVVSHYVVIDEAIFFFSSETCAWLQSVQQDCQKFLESDASRDTGEYNPQEFNSAERKLLDHFRAMPERFRNELGFRQLLERTGSQKASRRCESELPRIVLCRSDLRRGPPRTARALRPSQTTGEACDPFRITPSAEPPRRPSLARSRGRATD